VSAPPGGIVGFVLPGIEQGMCQSAIKKINQVSTDRYCTNGGYLVTGRLSDNDNHIGGSDT
jgi:hypothetical protein